MALTQADEKRIADLEAEITRLDNQKASKEDLEDSSVAPFVDYVTTKYIGDGVSKEWQERPALLLPDGRLIVLAPDDEGGVYTVDGAKLSDSRHIPNTWHLKVG